MSEHNLWENIRNKIGHTGHFVRIEFNITPGIPDVSFATHGVEGYMELKHTSQAPTRANTRVFGPDGLRDDQVTWIFKRTRAKGNVWIVPQIGQEIYLVPGSYCRTFNDMTHHQIQKASADYGPAQDLGWLAKALYAHSSVSK